MISTKASWIRTIGRLILAGAVFLLFLFGLNIRSRIYYEGPNLGFLLWISVYCFLTGYGLFKLKRWAVLLLFLPGVATAIFYAYVTVTKNAFVPMPWALLNYAFIIVLLVIPASMFRHWRELSW